MGMARDKREHIDTGTGTRYVRRDERGRFTEDQVDTGRSSATDQRRDSTTLPTRGQGDRGDRPSQT